MEKTIFSKDYEVLLRELRKIRKRSGLSQQQLAERLGITQSLVSKCERGERRIDVMELFQFCKALGVSPAEFLQSLQKALGERYR